ncbi:hypothetical protein PFAG_02037 [Plasmodium falciparum Santa Lucia]|uniref:Uncharacterized protein n=14 Tax=Plasmodium falciparum TaxID=5833 RepID=Q8IAY3_PLAF7|nr:conserved protein, unknown function [Plasmodium falciparum 3D7]ETW19060.1 hypothetical protein PFFVO_02079 [Plasmodium falciparum Vietnam Oak-Knoll (FVO)]ETW27201.1 hypothetical protein PFFCH_05378 [Plasmodium falciparum FCH/4]ETW37145.1 hypothetical protein PFTANZ_02153 [Plasmodium falciparum Tanzania (2000708)]ETW43291.1 hypothetical protein PFNF135_02204 [Plasmodium falciparum NF135/5.C10]ETW49909.1 hypothetical protein PFMALIP_02098 [Plasmodium falciparum MaliPS096_E11]ETW52515.1 hypot|eukprot:XP_001349378.1 conserved Plasmodium protein, unknown function [Plasmodium falciparum 3D7]
MTNIIECTFKTPPDNAKTPDNAVIWNQFQYCDEKGWYSLSNHDEIALRPTTFNDKRIKFLVQLPEIPSEFESILSGRYDAKAWGKEDCYVVIEGEKDVHIRLPGFKEKINYNHTERFPTFLKNWKIIVSILNEHVTLIRINAETALIININEKKNVTVKSVDFNNGFLCVNPHTNLAIAYGDFALSSLKKCELIQNIPHEGGKWGFFTHLFKWGHIIIPKELEIKLPSPGLKLIGKKIDTLAIVSIPPNIHIHVKLDGPKCIRKLEYGQDYNITAIKSSESDVDIYILFDGHLLKYEFSFDIRLNKPEKGRSLHSAKLKCINKSKEVTSFIFQETKNCKILLGSNCPSDNLGHLLNSQTIAIFDAEIGEYLSHPQGLQLTSVFNTLSYPLDKE